MMEVIVFAITLVVAQMVSIFITMKVFMSKKFIKKYSNMAMEISKELIEEMDV